MNASHENIDGNELLQKVKETKELSEDQLIAFADKINSYLNAINLKSKIAFLDAIAKINPDFRNDLMNVGKKVGEEFNNIQRDAPQIV